MQDSNAIKAQITSVERQIGDKQMQIRTDQTTAQSEQQRIQRNINDAMQHMQQPETEPGQHQSWQRRGDEFQAQLQKEMESMQGTQATHQSELETLQRRLADLRQEYQNALQREQEERIAGMAA